MTDAGKVASRGPEKSIHLEENANEKAPPERLGRASEGFRFRS